MEGEKEQGGETDCLKSSLKNRMQNIRVNWSWQYFFINIDRDNFCPWSMKMHNKKFSNHMMIVSMIWVMMMILSCGVSWCECKACYIGPKLRSIILNLPILMNYQIKAVWMYISLLKFSWMNHFCAIIDLHFRYCPEKKYWKVAQQCKQDCWNTC